MLVSRCVTGQRRAPDISGDDVNINIGPAAALHLISAGAGLHNQELHKQPAQPAQLSPAQPSQAAAAARPEAAAIILSLPRCLPRVPRQPGLGCPPSPAQPGLYFVAHITAPARAARTTTDKLQ